MGLPMHDKSAIDIDGLSGHMCCPVRGQEDDHVGDVRRRLPCSQGYDCPDFLIRPLFVTETIGFGRLVKPGLPNRPIQRCSDHARTDRIDSNPILRKILG